MFFGPSTELQSCRGETSLYRSTISEQLRLDYASIGCIRDAGKMEQVLLALAKKGLLEIGNLVS